MLSLTLLILFFESNADSPSLVDADMGFFHLVPAARQTRRRCSRYLTARERYRGRGRGRGREAEIETPRDRNKETETDKDREPPRDASHSRWIPAPSAVQLLYSRLCVRKREYERVKDRARKRR